MTQMRLNFAVSRAAATSACRLIDPAKPLSWEFSGFSQNREDGIIDYLCRQVLRPNRYFIEIGAGTGIENNTTWLALAARYSGLMIEGNAQSLEQCSRLVSEFSLGVTALQMFVEPDNLQPLLERALHRDPDFFSIDIDGNDYFVLKAVLEAGFRPKIVAVEFNSAYGPERSQTITYRPGFYYLAAHDSGLYYGVSISGWRRFLGSLGYRFVTIDGNGVNAFFIDPGAFDAAFVKGIRGLEFQENFYQHTKFRTNWESQFARIQDLDFHVIP